MSHFEPAIIGFLCNWCSYTGADQAGVARLQYPPNLRPIRVMCSGMVSPDLVMEAFKIGADGVMVMGCHPGECHYSEGNIKAAARAEVITLVLGDMGINPARFALKWISSAEASVFARLITEFTVMIQKLGPQPVRIPGQKKKRGCKKMSIRDQAMSILPAGGNLNSCFTCGICSSGCPASGLAGMDPRKFVRLLSLGLDEQIMANNWVWMCTTCNRCLHVCPMKVDIPKLVFLVRSRWPKDNRPKEIAAHCRQSGKQESCSSQSVSKEQFKSITIKVLDQIKKSNDGFDRLQAPIDKKNAMFFLNQNSDMLTCEPMEMGALWKILHLACADWTYGSKGWASENYCMFLSDHTAWKDLVAKKAEAVEDLGCKVLLNTECGHDFFAVKRGLEKFNIPHTFEIKNIIEYYAQWIREGRLKVNSDWNLDLKIKFTVQDPCQLVRKGYGDFIAEELRFIIKEAVGEENFIDMSPNCSNNYCCGGGGGAIQTDFVKERLTYGKVKLDQILETEAAYCITPCNNCHSQIRDLVCAYKANFNTVHLWTVIGLSLGILDRRERKYLGPDLATVGLKPDVVYPEGQTQPEGQT